MKKYITLFVFLFLTCSLNLLGQTITTTASSFSGCPGSISIPVSVTNCNGVGSISLSLNYNNAIMSYQGYQNVNSGLSSGILSVGTTGSKVNISWASLTPANIGNSTLIEIVFQALPGTGNLTWDLLTPGNCEYTNTSGQVLSSSWVNGNVTIYQTPSISTQPTNKAIYSGSGTSFSVAASGIGLTYLWQLSINGGSTWTDLTNNGVYSNVTLATMTLTNAQLSMSGYRFRCKVTGTCSPIAYSDPALLTVTPLIVTTCQSVSNCAGEIIVPIKVNDFMGVGAFSLALNINPSVVNFTGYQNLNPSLASGSFSANQSSGKVFVTWANNSASTISNGSVLFELKFNGTPGISNLIWDTITQGNCEYSDVNGIIIFSDWVNGSITVKQPPSITTNPSNQTIYSGSSASFSVTSLGVGLTYQWQVSTNGAVTWSDLTNGGVYSTVTTSTLNIANAQLGMSGYKYRCKVSGTCDPVAISNSANLTVTPLIITTCQSTTSCPGGLIVPLSVTDFIGVSTFSMVLSYNSSILIYNGYQNLNASLSGGVFSANAIGGKIYLSWYRITSATLPGGSTLIELKFTGSPGSCILNWDTQTPGNCEYSDNTGQIIFSNWINGTETITQSPVVTVQPLSKTVYSGSNTSFSITAIGQGLSYLWQLSTNGGITWSDLSNTAPYSGVTSVTLTINPAIYSMNGYLYRCYVTGVCSPFAYSNPALLTVTPTPITTTIDNISNSCTGNLVIPIKVTNCNNVGAISLALIIDPAKMSFDGYEAVNTQLNSGMLSINQSSNKVLLSWASMTAANIGNGNLISLRFRAISGISTTLIWDVLTTGNCEYSDVNGTIITSNYNNASVTVISNALIINAGNDATILPGNSIQLNGQVSGGVAPFIYLWSPSAGLSNPSILNPNATPASSTNYTLTVTGNNSCVATDNIQVNVTYLPPTVVTSNLTNVTYSSAQGGGNVTADGGVPVTARGLCWGTNPLPTLQDSHTMDGTGTGSFVSFISGLNYLTTYYARAYATNTMGTSYGSQVSFTTLTPPPNQPPTINAIADPLPILEDAGLQTIILTGISDGDTSRVQDISITASSSNVNIIPNPQVSYVQNSSTASLYYAPVSNANGSVTIRVKVKDNGGTAFGGVDTTIIVFHVVVLPVNDPPISNAGPDQTSSSGHMVILNGSSSSDPDGDPLTFHWTSPPGIVISNPNISSPTFTTPIVCSNTTYVFTLIVNDGTLNSLPDSVKINVIPVPPSIVVSPSSLNQVLPVGRSKIKEVKIKNSGLCNLSFSISPSSAWLSANPASGSVLPGDSSLINVILNSSNLIAGRTYNSTLTISSNDPNQPVIHLPVTLIVCGDLNVTATALPMIICSSGSSHLQETVTGGYGTFHFLWTSDPPGFSSSNQNPIVNPIYNTTYHLRVNDDFDTVFSQVSVLVVQEPLHADLSTHFLTYDTLITGSSQNKTFVLHNSGCDTLTFSLSVNSPFTLSQSTFSLPPNQDKTVTVYFSPIQPGGYQESIVFNTNASNSSELQIQLKGNSRYPSVDLSFQGLVSTDPLIPTVGDQVKLKFNLSLTGEKGFDGIQYSIKNLLTGESSIKTIGGFLSPGSTLSVEYQIPGIMALGPQNWQVLLDPYNLIPESNESNNQQDKVFQVLTKPELSCSGLILSDTMITMGNPITISNKYLNTGETAAQHVGYRVVASGNFGYQEIIASGYIDIPANSTVTKVVTFHPVQYPGTIVISSIVDYDNSFTETNESNNQLNNSFVAILPSPVLTVGGPNVLQVGQTQLYTFKITNSGLVNFSNVNIQLSLPPLLQIVSSNPVATNQGTLMWQFGNLSAGSSKTIQLQLLYPEGSSGGGSIVSFGMTGNYTFSNLNYQGQSSMSVQLGIDTRPPQLTLNLPAQNISSGSLTVGLTANEPLKATPTFKLINPLHDTILTGYFSGSSNTWSANITAPPTWIEGNYVIYTLASDLSGNSSATQKGFIFDNTSPHLTVSLPSVISHQQFTFTVTSDEALQTRPSISITSSGAGLITPVLQSQSGFTFRYVGVVPSGINSSSIHFFVSISDLASLTSTYDNDVPTDFTPPIITHNLPNVLQQGTTEVTISSDEALLGKPQIWITNDLGQSVTFQGPFNSGVNSYKVFINATLSGYEGKIHFTCSASDVAGNSSLLTKEMLFDKRGPGITIISDPEIPSGNFSIKVFFSEPVQNPVNIIFYGNEPRQILQSPQPVIHEAYYEYPFVNKNISKVSIIAKDTMNNSSSASKTYCDLAIPQIPFQFSSPPMGVDNCIVQVPVQNLSGLKLKNIPLVLMNYSLSPPQLIGDTVFVDLEPYQNSWVSINWPAGAQTNQLNLFASINPKKSLSETSYLNNTAMFRRFHFNAAMNKKAYEKDIDLTADLKLSCYSAMTWDTLVPPEISSYVKVIHQKTGSIVLDSLGYQFTNPQFNFHIPVNQLIDTGFYKAIVFVNDTVGLAPMTDTLVFYLAQNVSITVQTNDSIYNRSQPVIISGRIGLSNSGFFANKIVTLLVQSRYGTRSFTAATDQAGQYSLTFNPLSQEAGEYTVIAKVDYNGIVKESQSAFSILGLMVNPSTYNIKLSRNSSLSGSIWLKNIGTQVLNSLSSMVLPPADPQNINVILGNVPGLIHAGENLAIPYQVVSGAGAPTNVKFEVKFTTDLGEEEIATMNITTSEAIPHVFATSSNNEVILSPGQSKNITINFVNDGYETAVNPTIEIPGISFLQMFNSSGTDHIAIGDTISYNLMIAPDSTIQEGLYTGYLKLTCDNYPQIQTGISIFITKNVVGNLLYHVNSSLGNSLNHTTVFLYSQVYNPYTHSYPVYTGLTDTAGNAYFDNIPGGLYYYQAQAQNHSNRTGSFTVNPTPASKLPLERYQLLNVILNFSPVTYEWNVTPTTIQDQYSITLSVNITPVNNIRPPILVPTPNTISYSFTTENVVQGSFRISNLGDLTAYDIFPVNNHYIINDALTGVPLYRININGWDDLLGIGLPKNGTAVVYYSIERLYEHNELENEYHIYTVLSALYNQYKVQFQGKYIINGTIQTTGLEVQLDLKSEGIDCLNINPLCLFRTIMNNQLVESLSTTQVTLHNPTQTNTVSNFNGLGVFLYSQSFGFQSLLEDFLNTATFGIYDVLDKLKTIYDVATGDVDVSIASTDIPPSSYQTAEVNWNPYFTYDFAEVSVGVMAYCYDCSGSKHLGFLPIFQTVINLFGLDGELNFSLPTITGGADYTSGSSGGSSTSSGGSVSTITDPQPIDTTEVRRIHLTIDQKLSLERQAFNVELKLNNDTDLPVENFAMNVITKDEFGTVITSDQTSRSCPFFFSEPTLTNIDGIDGTGSISPHHSAIIHWLVIPRQGSGGVNGIGYQFQGHFSFTYSGIIIDTTTTSSDIRVNPMPYLDIDYSLPESFSKNEKFYMAVDIANKGYGSANNVKLTSGQPTMDCYNVYGNLVNCQGKSVEILNGYLGNQLQSPELTINYGNILPSQSKVGFWEMLANFNGLITGFDASITHSSELGGESTSLVDPTINTYILSRVVKVPQFNKSNGEMNFLAIDSTADHVPDYVLDAATGIKLPLQVLTPNITHQETFEEPYLSLSLNNSSGWGYFNVPEPFSGSKDIAAITSSAGYVLDQDQYWLKNNRIYVLDNMIQNASYTISFSDPPRSDISIYEEMLTLNPQNPIVGVPVNFDIKAYNGGDLTSGLTSLRLFKVLPSGSMNLVVESPVNAIMSGQTYLIQGIIPPGQLSEGINHFRFILDPDSLLNDENRLNNIIDFNISVSPQQCLVPVNLSVSIDSLNSAVAHWSPGGNESQWDIVWGLNGFNPLSQGTLIESLSNNSFRIIGLAPGTNYSYYVRANCGSAHRSNWAGPVTWLQPPISYMLNLKVFLQGLFEGNGTMHKTQNEIGDQFPGDVVDQIKVELHNPMNYSSVLYSFNNINLSISGYATVIIPISVNGSYYVTVRHRNSIETTSAYPILFNGNSMDVRFDRPEDVFRGNLYETNGYYCIFGGDVNQDGIVDGTDMADIDNTLTPMLRGYVVEDITGDGVVDGSEMAIVDNNSTSIVIRKTP